MSEPRPFPLILIGYRGPYRPRKPVLGIVPDRTPKEGYKPLESAYETRECRNPHCSATFRVRALSPQAFCSNACGKRSDQSGISNEDEP